jgi:hypothetical protein
MADRPILFSGAMVKAILSGTKTQTRRPVAQRYLDSFGEPDGWESLRPGVWRAWCHHTNQVETFTSPFGEPGDRLWARETFGLTLEHNDDGEPTNARRVLDGDGVPRWIVYRTDQPDVVWTDGDGYTGPSCWKPSIHMPRWASRLTLEVMSVRADRLHDLSEEDARAEGAEVTNGHPELGALIGAGPSYLEGFAQLWRSINGPGSWEANPWLWCVAFRRAG